MPSLRKACQTDLSDAEWFFLKPLLPLPYATGRPKTHSTPEILNPVFYIVRGGCAWRLLPNDLEHPGRPSTINLPLLALGRDVGETSRCPAKASASSPEEGPSAQRGHSGQPVHQEYRGGRKRARLRWRKEDQGHSKRHLLVDTQGSGLEVRVHSAKVMDLKTASSACWLLPAPIAFLASRTCGWTRATTANSGAQIGCKR